MGQPPPFSLFKRGSVWFYSKMVRGRRVRTSLHTDDKALALAAARRLHAEQLAGEFTMFEDASVRGWATAAELRKAYLEATDVRANAATRARNFGDLCRAMELVYNCERLGWHAGHLTVDFVSRWKTARLAQARTKAAGNALVLEAGKRALNDTLAHWQSVFCAPALEAYRLARLKVPDRLADLAAVPGVPAEAVPEPEPLSAAQLEALEAAAPLLRERDPATWVVYQLMAFAGLRNVECAAATWDWIGRRGEDWFLRITRTAEFKPKRTSGAVGLERGRVAALLELKREGDPHIVPADHATDRADACYRRINAWLRGCGIEGGTGGKLAYRLRRQFGATVMEEQGAEAAMAALRHGSRDMAKHYVSSTAKIAAPIAALRGGDTLQGPAALERWIDSRRTTPRPRSA